MQIILAWLAWLLACNSAARVYAKLLHCQIINYCIDQIQTSPLIFLAVEKIVAQKSHTWKHSIRFKASLQYVYSTNLGIKWAIVGLRSGMCRLARNYYNLSAAFKTTDPKILLDSVEKDLEAKSNAHFYWHIKKIKKSRVPQGSLLGPLLFGYNYSIMHVCIMYILQLVGLPKQSCKLLSYWSACAHLRAVIFNQCKRKTSFQVVS